MFKGMFDEIVAPVVRRLGTAAAAGAGTLGATTEMENQVALAVTMLCGVGYDLFMSRRFRNKSGK